MGIYCARQGAAPSPYNRGVPRILAVASSVDLDFRYGCTPAWWQLWKGLCESGVDLIVTPYRGRPIESPWWRSAPNPAYHLGESYAAVRDGFARIKGDSHVRRSEESPEETALDRATRETIWRVVTPRWRRHLERLVERERPDAVLVFTVPMAHFRGIPAFLRERFGIPIVFYDGDVPASLPEFGGMDTGFNYYHGADPSEYDLVLSNSEGGIPRLLELGARTSRDHLLGGGSRVLPATRGREGVRRLLLRLRRQVPAGMDGGAHRRAEPDGPAIDVALGGRDFQGDVGRARLLGDVPFNVFARAISAGRVNLNITRRSHATVSASSTCRPFELASAGAAIVSSPHAGIERWFEPGSELVVVENPEQALAAYRALLDDPAEAGDGSRGREAGALSTSAHRHGRRRLLELLNLRTPDQRFPVNLGPMLVTPGRVRCETRRWCARALRAADRRAEPEALLGARRVELRRGWPFGLVVSQTTRPRTR